MSPRNVLAEFPCWFASVRACQKHLGPAQLDRWGSGQGSNSVWHLGDCFAPQGARGARVVHAVHIGVAAARPVAALSGSCISCSPQQQHGA